MAFYGNIDETPYAGARDYEFGVSHQYSSPYELGESSPIDYTSFSYYKDHYSEPINYTSSIDYHVYSSETSYSHPRFLRYEPPPHYEGYYASETKFTVSYNNVEFNEPEFEEYDPTPYDGGYDQSMTYGKPLPPSDLTCYPRSMPQSDGPPSENFSYDSIPSPYGKDEDLPFEPPKRRKPKNTIGETQSHVEENGVKDGDSVDVITRDDSPLYEMSGDHACATQIPYGLGLETIDLCESIFGYWPCLAKNAHQQQQQRIHCRVCNRDGRMDDPWKTAADYLFGSPGPYDYNNYNHHQSPYQPDQVYWLQ